MYNISPKEIAPFNKLALEKGLSLNQSIKIPLTANNFAQRNATAADEVLVPVYYTVKEKEGLYRVSTNFNKVPLETLKQWNNLKTDAVSNGTKLIVGYLKVKKELSPLAGMAKAVPATNTVAAAASKPDVSNETLPVTKNPEATTKEPETKPAVAVVKKDPPVTKPAETTRPAATVRTAKNFNGGFFKSEFEKQAKNASTANENGTGAIFKSTSGWDDGKYYCLHNTAAPGTIVKVSNTATGKSIYAKVLDLIPDITQNNGVLIRLSNAAAAELGVGETKFDCTVSYSK
jgi:rare lipoprotein A (peptidoglycan hydrolase)